MKDLLEAGADLSIKDTKGHTALDIAKRNGRRKEMTDDTIEKC